MRQGISRLERCIAEVEATRESSQAAHRAKTFAVDGDGDAIAQLDLVALNRNCLALQRRRLEKTEKGDRMPWPR
jgi:hypothetical protein